MNNSLKTFYQLLTGSDLLRLVYTFIIMQLAAILSGAIIFSVMIFISLLTNQENRFIRKFFSLLNLDDLKSDFDPLLYSAILTVILVFLNQVFQLVKTRAVASFSFHMQNKLSTNTVDFFLSSKYAVSSKVEPSKFASKVTTLSLEATTQFVAPLLEALSSLTMLFFIMSSLLILSSSATILMVAIIFPALYFSYLISRAKIEKVADERIQADNVKHSIIQDILHNLRFIYLSNSAVRFPRKIEGANDVICRSEVIVAQYSILPKLVIEGVAYITLVVGGVFIFQNNTGTNFISIFPMLGAFAVALQRMMPEVQRLYVSLTRMKYGAAAFKEIASDIVEIDLLKKDNPRKTLARDFRSLEISDLRYKNPQTDKLLFATVDDIKITFGDKICLFAPSGSGKSTFLDIICGLIIPDHGQLLVKTKSREFDYSENYMLDVCYVSQAVTILNGTLEYNIALKEILSKDEDVRLKAALKNAKLENGKFANPRGLYLYDNGKGLSGGERQRIGLARAFYKNAEITVLDEATSAIDKESEDIIIENILKFQTLILVTHNENLRKRFENVLEIQNLELRIQKQKLKC